jgi:predicted PurR-regulated permease PerM
MIPFSYLLNVIAKESIGMYKSSVKFIEEGNAFFMNCTEQRHIVCSTIEKIQENPDLQIGPKIEETIGSLSQSIVKGTAGFLAGIPDKILQFFVLILTIFFMFIDGPMFIEKIKKIIPLTSNHKMQIDKEFSNIVQGIIYGQLLTSLAQGFIASIGFFVFGIRSPLTWGLFTMFFSLIPFLGAASIWAPLSAIKLIISLVNNDLIGAGKAIGLAVYGFFIISTVDNIIKPKLIGDKANIHPLVAFLSILGGLITFGIAGVILGPVIFALFIAVINIYIRETS